MLDLKSVAVTSVVSKILIGAILALSTAGFYYVFKGDTISIEIQNKHAELIQNLSNAYSDWNNLAVKRFNERVNELYNATITSNIDPNKLETIKQCLIALYKEYHWDEKESMRIITSHWESLNTFVVKYRSLGLTHGPGNVALTPDHLNMLSKIDEIIDVLDLDREQLITAIKKELEVKNINSLLGNEKYL
jgi:hypothetical protein